MIKALEENAIGLFFSYLDEQLKGNGKEGAPLYQPLSRSQTSFPKAKEASFRDGLRTAVGNSGWRRVWVDLDKSDRIRGHVDLRARPEPYSSHRAILGMGVDSSQRRSGIGSTLLGFVTEWATNSGLIEFIDLEVLSGNFPAINLYEKAGFLRVCEIEDMFRIDGRSEAHILMTKRLRGITP